MNNKLSKYTLAVNILVAISLLAIVGAKLVNEKFQAREGSGFFILTMVVLVVLLTITSVLSIIIGTRKN